MSIGHEVGVIKLPDMAAGHGNPSVLTNQIQRYITELSAAGSMYDQFSSPIVLDGDFEWEMEFFGVTNGLDPLISSSVGDNLARIQLDGTLRSFGGNDVTTRSIDSTTVVNDGKIRTLGGSRAGTTITARVNGVIEGADTNANNTGTITVDTLFTSGSNYSDGGWLSLKIWKGGDRTTGTLVMDAKKDGDGTSNVIVNDAAVLGAEEWAYDPIVADGTTPQYGVIAGGYGAVLTMGKTYEVTARWENLTGKIVFLMGDESRNTGSVTSDTGELVFIAETTDLGRTVVKEGALSSVADNITVSIKEIPAATPYITRVNQTSADASLYTQVSDGWEGEELWTYGVAVSSGAEGAGQLIAGSTSDNSIISGNTYRYNITASGVTSGEIRYQLGASDVVVTSVDGSFEGDHTVVSNDNNYVRVGGVQCNAVAAMAVSTKRFLEVAS